MLHEHILENVGAGGKRARGAIEIVSYNAFFFCNQPGASVICASCGRGNARTLHSSAALAIEIIIIVFNRGEGNSRCSTTSAIFRRSEIQIGIGRDWKSLGHDTSEQKNVEEKYKNYINI